MLDEGEIEKESVMAEPVYPNATRETAEWRRKLAPAATEAFESFSRTVFQAGALDEKTKQLIAVAVAHVTQCPYCIRGHTKLAHRKGATGEEIMEAVYVAAEMRAGAAYAHSTIAVDALEAIGALDGHGGPDGSEDRDAATSGGDAPR
jgi:AhpD family alkylhydroperoxidase